MSKKVFIGMSSYDSIPKMYFEEARRLASLCAEFGYDLVFGACTSGLMGEVYNEYLQHKDRDITAVCMRQYESDLELIPEVKNKIIFESTLEQIEYFMTCDKLIYLPGGYGTLTELIYLINAKVNKNHDKDIIIVNTNHFYDKIIEHFNKMFAEGFINDIKCFIEVRDIEDLKNYL